MTTLDLIGQILILFVLAIPVASIAWTVTHEEVFREFHEYFVKRSRSEKTVFGRKFFYLFTCEYCFSHYVTILLLIFTRYTLLLPDWRGYVLAGFSIVWIANVYMSLFALIRVDLRSERLTADIKEKEIEE